jgi:hypothetical protein
MNLQTKIAYHQRHNEEGMETRIQFLKRTKQAITHAPTKISPL